MTCFGLIKIIPLQNQPHHTRVIFSCKKKAVQDIWMIFLYHNINHTKPNHSQLSQFFSNIVHHYSIQLIHHNPSLQKPQELKSIGKDVIYMLKAPSSSQTHCIHGVAQLFQLCSLSEDFLFFKTMQDLRAAGDLDYTGRAAWSNLMIRFFGGLRQLFRRMLPSCLAVKTSETFRKM